VLWYYNETLPAQSLQLGKESEAQGAIGGVVKDIWEAIWSSAHCQAAFRVA
jgi:hypothetical protein